MEKDFSLFNLIVAILRRKKILIINFFCAFIIAIGISLLLPKSYKSSVVFIPPGQTAAGLLSMFGNELASDALVGSKFSKRQYIAILQSRELREQLVYQYDLIKAYKLTKMKNSLDLTLKILNNNIIIKEEEEGGFGITDVIIVNVTVFDSKPQRASDMANSLFNLLEKKVIEINRREYVQQIEFLNQQTAIDDSLLICARKDLKIFQINNKMYDIPSQIKITVRSLSQLEADRMSLEIQKAYLQKSFSSQYSGINTINDKLSVCNQKIAELENKYDFSLVPGLQRSLELSDKYIDLYKEVETYIQLKFLLRQQLEIAKLRYQRNYSSISLIDHARPAQYKFKPKRSLFVILVTSIYMIFFFLWILFKDYVDYIKRNNPEKIRQLINELKINTGNMKD